MITGGAYAAWAVWLERLRCFKCAPGGSLSSSHLYILKRTYLEADVVADEDVPLHEVPLVLTVFSDHREGVVHGGAQDADERLDSGVRIHVGQVGFHDVTGSQP